jgi:hypothetical protein
MCRPTETPLDRAESALKQLLGWVGEQTGHELGTVIVRTRQLIDGYEAVCAEATRRFEKAGGYRADGALGMVPWMRSHAKLSGGAAAERVETARQLGNLPRTEEALARGEIGYQHAVAMAKAAEHVGAAAVRKSEGRLLEAAHTMDPGQFITVAKTFEHQVDAGAALDETNRAHQRRYLTIGDPVNGLARIEGQLVAEAVATIRTAIEPYLKPQLGDDRSAGQRAHDALVQALLMQAGTNRGAGASTNGAAPRPLLIIKTTVDTLADSAISRMVGLSELAYETTRAARTIPPATRRALRARDGHCVFPGCDRPPPWCDAHHLIFWADGGPTKLDNLGLVCGAHHRKVHEEGWSLQRRDGRWVATAPPLRLLTPRARTG